MDFGRNVQDLVYSYKLCDLLRNTIGMQDFPRIIHICHFVLETECLGGDMVEFGCFVGHTAKLMTALSERTVHVYDSFEGLPTNGEMRASVQQLLDNFNTSNIRLPVIHYGWFKDLTAADLPSKISFAHLDGDTYSSIKESLALVYGRMVKDGIILVDDYDHPNWPLIKQAVTEFFVDKPERHMLLSEIPKWYKDTGTKAYIKKL